MTIGRPIFYKTNRFESNRIYSNRELLCSNRHTLVRAIDRIHVMHAMWAKKKCRPTAHLLHTCLLT